MTGQLPQISSITVNTTNACNSRCVMCDYWRNVEVQMSDSLAVSIAAEAAGLGARTAVLSGGEPLSNPNWQTWASAFRKRGLSVSLVTNGLLLRRYEQEIHELIDTLYVSFDAWDAESYRLIRGVDGFLLMTSGVQRLSESKPVVLRTVLQEEPKGVRPHICHSRGG